MNYFVRPLGLLLGLLFGLILRLLIRVYQLFLSPILGNNCRYTPSCSQYAMDAIETHGPLRGCWLALKRISRCHPWGNSGYDPVPAPSSGSNPGAHSGPASRPSSSNA